MGNAKRKRNLAAMYTPREAAGAPVALPCEGENNAPTGACVTTAEQCLREGWMLTAYLLYAVAKGRLRWGKSTFGDYFLSLTNEGREMAARAVSAAHTSKLAARESEDAVLLAEHVLAMEQGSAVAGVNVAYAEAYHAIMLMMGEYMKAALMVERGHARWSARSRLYDLLKDGAAVAVMTDEGREVHEKIGAALGHHFGGGGGGLR